MLENKSYAQIRAHYRKKLISKIQDLLDTDKTLEMCHYKEHNISVDVVFKNEEVLVVANKKFEELFNRVDFNLSYEHKSYESKDKNYKSNFKRAYNQCKEALKSNGNISLNAAMVGVIGALYSPTRISTGYVVYSEMVLLKEELYILDNIYFTKLEEYEKEEISINDLVKLIYYLSKEKEYIETPEEEIEDETIDDLVYSRNKILFGPPGTGKSYNIKSKMNLINVKNKNVTRITFHPEYSYYEFVGQYKPVVAYEKVAGTIRYPHNDKVMSEKAFVYYDFVPGPFTKAIVDALKLEENAEENVPENALLVIEEINRGNSSAIFGDVFQLLDRINDVNDKCYGESEYSIDIPVEMKEYIKEELKWEERDWIDKFEEGFIIPSNLYIYSTMNTSDQSLYPMDSAFKRRWDMEYMYINYREEKLEDLYLPEPYEEIKWLDFIERINREIVNYTEVDDKQIGQWFVGKSLSESEFLGKVVSYLWFDIFRYDPETIFKKNIKTFDDIRIYYDGGIFKEEFIDDLMENRVSGDEE